MGAIGTRRSPTHWHLLAPVATFRAPVRVLTGAVFVNMAIKCTFFPGLSKALGFLFAPSLPLLDPPGLSWVVLGTSGSRPLFLASLGSPALLVQGVGCSSAWVWLFGICVVTAVIGLPRHAVS